MKTVLRAIRVRLLAPLPLPAHVHGCVRGRSPLTNATTHRGQPNVASIDIKTFYPSVTNAAIYKLWIRLGYGEPLASLLTRLTTLAGHLPQGAPTSDALANHVLAPVDDGLIAIVARLDLKLSRYLDNIDLSGRRTREAIPLVIALLHEHGYSVRHKKTFNAGPRSTHIVTGYTANNRRLPSVARLDQRRIRSAAYELIQQLRAGRPSFELTLRLRGRMAHLRQTNPGAAAAIERQLGAFNVRL
jgi:retron-type reverse transcriptase